METLISQKLETYQTEFGQGFYIYLSISLKKSKSFLVVFRARQVLFFPRKIALSHMLRKKWNVEIL